MNSHETSAQLATALLTGLADKLAQFAVEVGKMPEGQAREIGEKAAMYVADYWGGQMLYIPKNVEGKRRARNHQIYSEWTGNNAPELAAKYELSIQAIYRIVAVELDARRQKQCTLPGCE